MQVPKQFVTVPGLPAQSFGAVQVSPGARAPLGSSKTRVHGSARSPKSGMHAPDAARWRSSSRQAALTSGSRVHASLAIDCLQTLTSAVRPFVVQQGTTAVQKSARNAWSAGERG